MKRTIDMFQFFNEFRNKTFFIPIVTQRAYAWDEERADLYLELICEHIKSETEYYFTSVAVRELTKELEKIGDGGNRIVTYMLIVSSLVNFINNNRDKLEEKYKTDITSIDYHVKQLNDMILWKNISTNSPRILLEDEKDMRDFMYCLRDDNMIFKVKNSKIIKNYIVSYNLLNELFIEKNGITLIDFIEKGLGRITTLIEECETEDEETELFFLKNASIGVELNTLEILGNSFNGYPRKFEKDEEKIKVLQDKNKKIFIKLKKVFANKNLFSAGLKKSFFTLFCYYLDINTSKKLIPYKEVSRKLDKYIKNVLSGKEKCKFFNNVEELIDTFSYFIDFTVKMVQKNFPDFKYSDILNDMPINNAYYILATDLLTNKYDIDDNSIMKAFKYGKKIFILHTFKKAGAHPENIFCGIIKKCVENSKIEGTTLSEQIEKEFQSAKYNVLDNDTSAEKIKSYILHDGFYKRGTGFKNLVLDEINEVLDYESHLRPFSIKKPKELTIEHICPQSIFKDHPNLHKIGNLCFLSKERNSSFSNKTNWGDKYNIYTEYPWAINKTLKKYTDSFTLNEEFIDRNNILCDAFVKAMEIGERPLILKTTYSE